jgi:ubiquinone/menaquinone biosynthesis C-methylase UbiE
VTDEPAETSRILEETKEYYRQRASQFADWHRHTGEYEDGPPLDQSYFNEAKVLFDAVESEHLIGNVLEIASGTGIWTEAVIKTADALTALDSSKEMLEKCTARLGTNPKIRYVVADFFDWIPDREYDAVTFSFMISHVPASKLDEFVLKLSRCLRHGGKVFFVDQQTQAVKNEELQQPGGEVAWRTLQNGRRFKVFKHFYTSEEIQESFLGHGLKIKITNTPTHFFYAYGQKTPEAKSNTK